MATVLGLAWEPGQPLCLPFIHEGDRRISLEQGIHMLRETFSYRQQHVLEMRFGFDEEERVRPFREIGGQLLRTDGGVGVALELARKEYQKAVLRCRYHPVRRGWLKRFVIPAMLANNGTQPVSREEIRDLALLWKGINTEWEAHPEILRVAHVLDRRGMNLRDVEEAIGNGDIWKLKLGARGVALVQDALKIAQHYAVE